MNQKSVFSSQTVLALVVMAIAALCRYFKLGVSDQTVNDIAYLVIQTVCSVWAFFAHARAEASQPTALTFFGMVLQLAPQVQKIADDLSKSTPPPPTPAEQVAPSQLTSAGGNGPSAGATVGAVLLCLALGLGLSGCATNGITASQDFATTSYKAMATAGIAYDAAMQTAGVMHGKGQITEEQKGQIVRYGNAFRGAYMLAQTALEQYVKLGSTDATLQAQAVQALTDMAGRLSELKGYVDGITTAMQGSK